MLQSGTRSGAAHAAPDLLFVTRHSSLVIS